MKITLLPGDGIGPEIIDAAVEVLNAVAEKHGLAFAYDHQLIGGAAFDATGSPLPEATVKSALQADAVLGAGEMLREEHVLGRVERQVLDGQVTFANF